ncbi:MAG: haloalkane dehalogenase [Pseudomonadota bacterium]
MRIFNPINKVFVATILLFASFTHADSPALMPYEVKRIDLGYEMAYVDEGSGDPVVFLHGNPTSSYLWRNIMPAVVDTHRVIAPDLIGMGDSEKPNVEFGYEFHREYLFKFLEKMDLRDVTLVVHDWGSVLGLDWAQQNEDRVKSLVIMEAVLPPVWPVQSYDLMGEMEEGFKAFRTPGVGEQLIIEQNAMINGGLGQQFVLNPLSAEVLEKYNGYYTKPEQRQVILQWTRDVPIAGKPANVVEIVESYSKWLLQAEMPKMLIHAQPGVLVPPQAVDWLQQNVPNLTTVDIGSGVHFIQEDNPTAISAALETWVSLN